MATRLILPLSENSKVTKARLIGTLNEIAGEVNTIHDLYVKFFDSTEGRKALARQIEDELELIKKKHSELFENLTGESSKVDELDRQIEEIKKFHQELLEGEDSIQGDIKESQDRITAFYLKLFHTGQVKGDGGQEAKLNAAIQSITSFDDTLNKADIGYRAKIELAKDEILTTYNDLLGKDKKTSLSKVDLLNQHIVYANDFHDKVEKEISPFIGEKQTLIDEVTEDLQTKRREIDSLLSETTVKALAQGYREAMQIYGDPVYGSSEKGRLNWLRHKCVSSAKSMKHFLKFIGSYALFIGPLLLIGWLFVTNGWQGILNMTQDGTVKFSGTEYIFYKLTIALPLLWVSWYGQKNIAHRKRLFEEYNHKLRVVQMYMHFVGNDSTYTLDPGSRIKLEATLLDTIERNPSEVYGKDDTLIDKLISLFQSRWASKSQKGDVPAATSANIAPAKSKS